MAASDPATDVPTPTGTLQGVAAFSWDGSAWQPAGRAGPSVATPTGVLRGVAAFNGGPAWQPAALAQPGVTTPSGTLDGVAVYTWTGDSWAPPGGTATPSTPHGALRGVAAFNWDGAAWQPAGQAGPSVATPYGVLDGVAMFGWTGSAWAATGAPSLSLDFMTPGVLDPRITFTRASTATYFDVTGTMQTAAANAPRWDYNPVTHALNGLFIEETRTNSLLNSATLGTQGVAVTAQAYTLSFYGTGTITMSGAFAGSLVGAGGFPARASTTFTPAAGTLTCTVTGSVLSAQLEAGPFITSWIPTTGAAVTRQQDSASMLVSAFPSNALAFSYQVQAMLPVSGAGLFWVALDDTTTSNRTQLNTSAGLNMQYFENNAGVTTENNLGAGNITAGVVFKAAVSTISGQHAYALNSVSPAFNAIAVNPPPVTTLWIGRFAPYTAGSAYVQRISYWPRALSVAELQSVTT